MKTMNRVKKYMVIILSAAVTLAAGTVCAGADEGSAAYTIKYETSDGVALMDSETKSGTTGLDIEVVPAKIDGFKPTAERYSFTLAEDGQEFTVVYRRAGGTDIGSAYTTTKDGTAVETVSDEDVPMASGEITGYSVSIVENGEKVPLSSGAEAAGLADWQIIMISVILAAAAAGVVIYFIRHFREISELKESFEDATYDSRK